MHLLVTSYTPGSHLLSCIDLQHPPQPGDILKTGKIHGEVKQTHLIEGAEGCHAVVILEDFTAQSSTESAFHYEKAG